MSYKHLSITEREKILFHRAQGLSFNRNKSTVSRELTRNDKDYSLTKAQARYKRRRKKSCTPKKLVATARFALVKKLLLA